MPWRLASARFARSGSPGIRTGCSGLRGDVWRIEVIKSDIENDLLYLKGSIPGSKNAQVFVKKSVKNISRLTILEKNEKIDKSLLRYLTVKVIKFDLDTYYFKKTEDLTKCK